MLGLFWTYAVGRRCCVGVGSDSSVVVVNKFVAPVAVVRASVAYPKAGQEASTCFSLPSGVTQGVFGFLRKT